MSDTKPAKPQDVVVIDLPDSQPNQPLTQPKKKGSPLMVKGQQSLNPAGRPKKPLSKSAKVKDDLFTAWCEAGGKERLINLCKPQKIGKTKESRAKATRADERFLKLTERLFGIVPKETQVDVETKSVIFVLGDQEMKVTNQPEPQEESQDDVVNVEPEH